MEQSELETAVEDQRINVNDRDPETIKVLYPGMKLNKVGEEILVKHIPEGDAVGAEDKVHEYQRNRSFDAVREWIDNEKKSALQERQAFEPENFTDHYTKTERFKASALGLLSRGFADNYRQGLNEGVLDEQRTVVLSDIGEVITRNEREAARLDDQYQKTRHDASNKTAEQFREERWMICCHESREEAQGEIEEINGTLAAAYKAKDESLVASLEERHRGLVKAVTDFELAESVAIRRVGTVEHSIVRAENKSVRLYDKRQVVGAILSEALTEYDRIKEAAEEEDGGISSEQMAADLSKIQSVGLIVQRLGDIDYQRVPPPSVVGPVYGSQNSENVLEHQSQEMTKDYNAALKIVDQRRQRMQLKAVQ
ncbi:hypothetical protein GOV07_00795 [Candidatus Woesearchaeota archaeon]|nr:hypothetical protein [Candidatus Woesearchaeota archaeon]